MNPYRTIWFSPKQTFNELILTKNSQPLYGIPLFILGLSLGINSSHDMASVFGEGDTIIGIITGIIIFTALIFLFLGFIYPWLLKIIGSLWNGKGTLNQLTNVVSISFIPYGIIVFFQILLLSFGLDPNSEKIYGGLTIVVSMWTLSLFIIGVSKIQGFSYGFALLNILMSQLPFLLLRLALRS